MGSIIRERMEEKGINVSKLSELTGIGRVNLGYKLKGQREMTVNELLKIFEVLHMSGQDFEKGML